MVIKLLDIYVKIGKRASAITYFNNFSNRLACSLGITPSKELKDKYNEIRLTLSVSNSIAETIENINVKADPKKSSPSYSKIVTACMKNVEYFWIADVVGKIADSEDEESIKQLSNKELMDLGYIQSKILRYCSEQWDGAKDYKHEVMSVCIINAFLKLLTNFCNRKILTIIILDSDNMDEISANVLKYLKKIQIENLNFVDE